MHISGPYRDQAGVANSVLPWRVTRFLRFVDSLRVEARFVFWGSGHFPEICKD